MSPAGAAAVFVPVAVLTGATLWRRFFWAGQVLLALSSALGLLL